MVHTNDERAPSVSPHLMCISILVYDFITLIHPHCIANDLSISGSLFIIMSIITKPRNV